MGRHGVRLTKCASKLGHQSSEDINLRFELLGLPADLNELCSILVNILLKVRRGSVLDSAQAVLEFLDIMLGCMRQQFGHIYTGMSEDVEEANR